MAEDPRIKRLMKSLGTPQQEVNAQLIGEENAEIEAGNTIIQKARIFDGDSNRVANLIDFLIMKGCDKEKLNRIRATIFGVSLGYCSEIPPFGMRGELLDTIRPREKPQQAPITQNILSNQTQDQNQKENNQ